MYNKKDLESISFQVKLRNGRNASADDAGQVIISNVSLAGFLFRFSAISFAQSVNVFSNRIIETKRSYG